MKPHPSVKVLSSALFVFGVALGGPALGFPGYGTTTDSYCANLATASSPPQQSRPFAARQALGQNNCSLCHAASTSTRVEPQWTWYQALPKGASAQMRNFCVNSNPINPAITAPPAGTTVSTGQPVTFTASGTDPDGFALSYTWRFSNGVPNATGQSVNVTPTAAGALTATLELRDANGAIAPTTPTRSVTVTAATPAPVANADSYSTAFGTTLNVVAPGVLANDTTSPGTALTAQLVTGPNAVQGTLTLNPNGSFTFTPAAGFSGDASFTYRASNGGTTPSANATVTIAVGVRPPPAAPVANADTYSMQAGQTLSVGAPGVLSNDTNPSGTGALAAQLVSGPASGTLSLNANGGFTYAPSIASGSVSFIYRASNGTATSGSATVTINVTPPLPVGCRDADGDGYSPDGGACGPVDCNDNNAALSPGAREICGDAIDNDCDGKIDSADPECNGTDCVGGLLARPVVITSASWESGDNELEVKGNQAVAGATVTVFNAHTGARIGSTTVGSNGAWEFESHLATAPCTVRVEINGQRAERAVSGVPNCGAPPPANRPPVATITAPATNVTIARGGAVDFAGKGSDPDGNPITFAWAFNGATSASASVADPAPVTFNTVGTFTVTLTVRDSLGATGTASRRVTVTAPPPPVANLQISEAEWHDGALDVRGSGAPAQTQVRLKNASTGAVLATTSASATGAWRFEVRQLAAPPCTVKVESGTRVGTRAVSDAPGNCVR